MDTTKTGFCQAVEEFSRKKKIFAAGAGCSKGQPAFCMHGFWSISIYSYSPLEISTKYGIIHKLKWYWCVQLSMKGI